MQRVCVYCGSSPGGNAHYVSAARDTGAYLAARNLTLVYGGGNVGMMGELASAALTAGGKVIGVIPEDMVKQQLAHSGLDDLRVVESMHQRKSLMAELADAFITLPGGFGTFEEFFEILTWAQLGLHHKPIGLLNVNGYYDRLIAFLQQTVDEKFINCDHYRMILLSDNIDQLMAKIVAFEAVESSKAAWAISLSNASK